MKMIYWQLRSRERKAIEVFLRIVLEKTDGTNSFDSLGNDVIASVTQNAGVSLSEIRTRTGEDIDKEKLRSLTIPVDFITGDLSPAFIRRSNSRLSGIFPAGKWEHIENGGHLALYECSEEFSRKVAELAGVKI